MRHAILIAAHHNFDHLLYLVNYFDADFDIYIHIDKKSHITLEELSRLRQVDRVCGVYQKYAIHWGGYSFLKTILYLVKQVAAKGGVDYVHLISGADIPIKRLDEFKAFFLDKPKYEYLENFSLPARNWVEGGLNRVMYYHLHDLFNVRKSKNMKWEQTFVQFQKRWHIQRTISSRLPRFYGGGNWWSLSWECVDYVVKYTCKNKRLLRRLKFSFASDEIYFQTVILNSPFAGRVVGNHMRYIDWRYRNGNMPANLDLTDLDRIINSSYLFARKIEFPVSGDLVERLKRINEKS